MSATVDRKPAQPRPRLALFLPVLRIGILGFGGVAAWTRHVLVAEAIRAATSVKMPMALILSISLPLAVAVGLLRKRPA